MPLGERLPGILLRQMEDRLRRSGPIRLIRRALGRDIPIDMGLQQREDPHGIENAAGQVCDSGGRGVQFMIQVGVQRNGGRSLFSGQINRRILRRQLEEFHAEDGELCAVALIKKVAGGKRGKAMKSFFKIQKLRPNRARFCRQSQLSGLLNFQGHLHIFLFRWRRPNLSQEVS